MNKMELIAEVALKAGLSKKDAEKALNATIDTITETLANGEKVQLVGFGGFETKKREARMGRNPKTKEAIDTDDLELMKEELGAVIMQVIIHAGIEEDRARVNMEDVCDGAVKKLVFRHPNVFGPKTEQTWDDMKALEKGQKTYTSTLDAVARSLPSLWRADKLVKKAEKAGFAWPDQESRLQKVREETAEPEQAICDGSNVEEELGDLLFAVVKVARFLKTDPEQALERTTDKFISRFSQVEQGAAAQGKHLEAMSVDEMMALWNAAKRKGGKEA